MLAVVVMLATVLIADITLELKLNPAAFKLPPIIFPVPETRPAPKLMLPPVMLPAVSTATVPFSVTVVVVFVKSLVKNVPTPVTIVDA